jgi:hypothetical protein
MSKEASSSRHPEGGGIELHPNGGDYRALQDGRAGPGGAWSSGAPKELRVNVFREVVGFGKTYPRNPRYYEARPAHFPPEITVFHFAALHSYVESRAVAGFTKEYNGAWRLATIVGCMIGIVVLFQTCPTLMTATPTTTAICETTDPTLYEASICVGAAVLAMLCGGVVYALTRPAARRLHDRMEVVVSELAPVFRRAGYDLAYCRLSSSSRTGSDGVGSSHCGPPRSCCLAQCNDCLPGRLCDESFVRIVPFDGTVTQEELDKADEIWAPTQLSVEPTGFRVVLCGSDVHPAKPAEHAVQGPSFLSLGLPESTQEHIDSITWAAMVSELRGCTETYQRIRLGNACAAIVGIYASAGLAASLDPPLWLLLAAWGVPMVFVYLVILTPTFLETLMMKPVLDKARVKVQDLSTQVEERTGYSLWLKVEPDGWLGGTAAYVYFEPGLTSTRDGGATSPFPLSPRAASQPPGLLEGGII